MAPFPFCHSRRDHLSLTQEGQGVSRMTISDGLLSPNDRSSQPRKAARGVSLSELLALAAGGRHQFIPAKDKYRRKRRRLGPAVKASGMADTCRGHGLHYCSRCDVGK